MRGLHRRPAGRRDDPAGRLPALRDRRDPRRQPHDAVRQQRDPPRRGLRRAGDGAGAVPAPAADPAAARGAALVVAVVGDAPRRRGGSRRPLDRARLLRAAGRRARGRLRGQADPGRDPTDAEPLGVRLRGRVGPDRTRLAAADGVAGLRPVHQRQPDTGRLRAMAALPRGRLRGRVRCEVRLPRRRRGAARPWRCPAIPARDLGQRALGALEGRARRRAGRRARGTGCSTGRARGTRRAWPSGCCR